ncbi:MAG: helix-turn-helix transcriptional regulator [Oscillospiraceae bacterium]
MLTEFIARSRRDGISCRFVRNADSVSDCAARVFGLLLGHSAFPPETDDELYLLGEELKRAPVGELLVVVDCPFSALTLLENLRTAELLMQFCSARFVIISDNATDTHISAAEALGMSVITEKELLFTREETEECYDYCGLKCRDIDRIYSITGGQPMRTKLCIKLEEAGVDPENGDNAALLGQYAAAALSRSELGVLMCFAPLKKVSEEYLRSLGESQPVSEYFGSDTFEYGNVCRRIKALGSSLGLCGIDMKTRAVSFHPHLKDFISRAVTTLPREVSAAVRECRAREYLRLGKPYYAFCEFFLAGKNREAAECTGSAPISLREVMGTKAALKYFLDNCPLDDKSLLKRYLRVLAMLMLTSEKSGLSGYYDRAIKYISSSPDYTEKERRHMLSYAFALRTYEDFFFIERMGKHIKRAYEYYDGTGLSESPFYTWNMYVPSLFGLIHNYSLSISTEREQFGRYQRMYCDMLDHGKYILSYYNAELAYFIGNVSYADKAAAGILSACGKEDEAVRLIGLLLRGKAAVYSGKYMIFSDVTEKMVKILHTTTQHEVYKMARLSLALLDMVCGSFKYSAFFACCRDDEDIRINRFAAPYYCLITAMYCLAAGKTERVIRDAEYYLSVADEVRNGTVRLQLCIILAETHLALGERAAAEDYAAKAASVLDGTPIYMPAAEVLVLCRRVREYYAGAMPEGSPMKLACAAADRFTVGAETVLTYKMTFCAANREPSDEERLSGYVRNNDTLRRQLGLNRREFEMSVFAAAGMTNEQIAQALSASLDSVKSCLKRVYAKTGIRSRQGLEALIPLHGVLK